MWLQGRTQLAKTNSIFNFLVKSMYYTMLLNNLLACTNWTHRSAVRLDIDLIHIVVPSSTLPFPYFHCTPFSSPTKSFEMTSPYSPPSNLSPCPPNDTSLPSSTASTRNQDRHSCLGSCHLPHWSSPHQALDTPLSRYFAAPLWSHPN